MDLFLLLLPWMALVVFAVLVIRLPRPLPARASGSMRPQPLVSVIIPARNEEENIGPCVSSLAASEYPAFEIIVVDDQSEDGTAGVVRGVDGGNATGIRVVSGRGRPEEWFGKPWACWQGAAVAKGDLLLFVDADTTHDPGLLARAVQELEESGGDALTLIGRQLMESFWERLLQPQFFVLLAFRFPRTSVRKEPHQWRNAIANGQYLLFRREVYEALGGHEAVAGEVVEDMRLAQLLVRGGWRLEVLGAEGLRTRMYSSLGGLVEGWGKNITTGALQATPRVLHAVILPFSLVTGTLLWLLPPGALAWCLVTGTSGLLLHWSAVATGFGVLFWGLASAVMKGNPLYGLLFPLGSVLSAYIFVRSWMRGRRIVWKGRSYRISAAARRGLPGPVRDGIGGRGAGPEPGGQGPVGGERADGG